MQAATATLPLSYQQKLNQRHEGFTAATFDNSSEYHNFTAALRQNNISFLTKIVKQKRKRGRARQFIVMVVEPPHAA